VCPTAHAPVCMYDCVRAFAVVRREVVLSARQDDFFARHMMSNFGDMGLALSKRVEHFASERKAQEQVRSIGA
jgi:hypothetical protein